MSHVSRILHAFHPADLPGDPAQKTALLINPPVYDTQYWAEWSQPYGLLRIAQLKNTPDPKSPPYRVEKNGQALELWKCHYRSRSFRVFGDTMVAQAFRENLRNGFEEFIDAYRVMNRQVLISRDFVNGRNDATNQRQPE